MKQEYWLNLGASLLVAISIIVATLTVKLANGSGWWVMTGQALLALFVVCAEQYRAQAATAGFAGIPNLKKREE